MNPSPKPQRRTQGQGPLVRGEHLTTGWEPDVSIDDTIVRRYLFHWAAYCDAYARAAGGAITRCDAWAAADLRRPSGYFNSATLLRPPGSDFGDHLADIETFYESGDGEILLWSPWPTPDLTARGWNLVGHPPLLIRPPARTLSPPECPDVDVERVRSPRELAEWERVAIEGYPMPELDTARPGELAHPSLLDDERFAFWIGRHDGVAVSISTSFVEHGIASFALAVTRPAARRRHHWRRHAVERLHHTADVWTAGVFSDHSRPGAQQIGFVPIIRLTLWSRSRPSST
jgi:hypothetical protein